MKQSRATLTIAIVLLLLPLLYVGSYFAVVVPAGFPHTLPPGRMGIVGSNRYRYGGEWSRRFYRPLEWIDRKLRPESWKRNSVHDLTPEEWFEQNPFP